jgi:hypothetical protein
LSRLCAIDDSATLRGSVRCWGLLGVYSEAWFQGPRRQPVVDLNRARSVQEAGDFAEADRIRAELPTRASSSKTAPRGQAGAAFDGVDNKSLWRSPRLYIAAP